MRRCTAIPALTVSLLLFGMAGSMAQGCVTSRGIAADGTAADRIPMSEEQGLGSDEPFTVFRADSEPETELETAPQTDPEKDPETELPETVKRYEPAGPTWATVYIGDMLGICQSDVIAELSAHEHDRFYLGTPYRPGDWVSPHGDIAYNGREGMNCGGFVSYVLTRVGLNEETYTEAVMQSGFRFRWANHSANGIYIYMTRYHARYLRFETKEAMLASGKLRRGDMIIMWFNHTPEGTNDNHIGFYWGTTPGEDLMWHSSRHYGENLIGPIVPESEEVVWYVVPISAQVG